MGEHIAYRALQICMKAARWSLTIIGDRCARALEWRYAGSIVASV